MEKIKTLQKMINACSNIVFFGGAGVSTESGLKDFRSKEGLYQEKSKYPAEMMLSATMFNQDQEAFFTYYKENFNCLDAKPNKTHLYLKKLEDRGKLKAIITQNIDGLDRKAGCKKVYEIHGSIYRNYCVKCHQFYPAEKVFQSSSVPRCTCGGVIKPDVVLYEEMLDSSFQEAIQKISQAEMLLVAGTSLTVEPAASLIRLFKGKYLVILNQEKTPYDALANLVIHAPLGSIFEELK